MMGHFLKSLLAIVTPYTAAPRAPSSCGPAGRCILPRKLVSVKVLDGRPHLGPGRAADRGGWQAFSAEQGALGLDRRWGGGPVRPASATGLSRYCCAYRPLSATKMNQGADFAPRLLLRSSWPPTGPLKMASSTVSCALSTSEGAPVVSRGQRRRF
jgi:hypothetical protein